MSTTIDSIYKALFEYYGDPKWWPGDTPFEIIVGAVLTQNCAWSNVEKAIANFKNVCELTPENLLAMTDDELAELIKPAGFFTRKAGYLKAVTDWFSRYNFDVGAVAKRPLHELRPELLAVKGVGKETADSILLYAIGFKTFVVDAYTARLCQRMPLPAGESYDERKRYFEQNFRRVCKISESPEDDTAIAARYNIFHVLIVLNAKKFCRKMANCVGCPLALMCSRKLT
jgi:endonuclease-3 related protein